MAWRREAIGKMYTLHGRSLLSKTHDTIRIFSTAKRQGTQSFLFNQHFYRRGVLLICLKEIRRKQVTPPNHFPSGKKRGLFFSFFASLRLKKLF